MAFAESSNHAVNLQFTVNGNPLFIQPDNGDFYETLFIVALTQVSLPSAANSTANNSQTSNRSVPQRRVQPQGRKRPLEDDSNRSASPSSVNGNGSERGNPMSQVRQRIERTPMRPNAPAQPLKAVVAMERTPSVARDYGNNESHDNVGSTPFPGGSMAMPPPSLPASLMNRRPSPMPGQPPSTPAARAGRTEEEGGKGEDSSPLSSPRRRASQMPLFLPGTQLSQLSRADEEAIIESGLGIENMDMDEFEAMMEGDGEEIEWNEGGDVKMRESSLDIFETQLPPTQESAGSKVGPTLPERESVLTAWCLRSSSRCSMIRPEKNHIILECYEKSLVIQHYVS